MEQIYRAGVVGAGGAGFPTHKKLAEDAQLLIVNAMECEPLLNSDRFVMRTFAGEIVEALRAIKTEYRIGRVVIGTKAKYQREIAALEAAIREQKADVELCPLKSFYPGGDEQVLIYEITGKTVPPGGIPLALGVVVMNVTTVYAVYQAMRDRPMIMRYVTVTGEVNTPSIVKVPVGASAADCIRAAGGARRPDCAVILGGPMMGRRHGGEEAETLRLGKADGAVLVLPGDHPLIAGAKRKLGTVLSRARSVCIQCRTCTELCPRYLIGHPIRPHRVMRSVATGTNPADLTDALLCCECGVCELFACPMMLSPRQVNVYVKGLLREAGVKAQGAAAAPEQSSQRPGRTVSQGRLIARLGLRDYPRDLDMVTEYTPQRVSIPLRHGVGRPAVPVVAAGERVERGQLVASLPPEELGCLVHASISGVVTGTDGAVTIEAEDMRGGAI